MQSDSFQYGRHPVTRLQSLAFRQWVDTKLHSSRQLGVRPSETFSLLSLPSIWTGGHLLQQLVGMLEQPLLSQHFALVDTLAGPPPAPLGTQAQYYLST